MPVVDGIRNMWLNDKMKEGERTQVCGLSTILEDATIQAGYPTRSNTNRLLLHEPESVDSKFLVWMVATPELWHILHDFCYQ